jgi:hypothetical protein
VTFVHPNSDLESRKKRDAYSKNNRRKLVIMSWIPGWNSIAGAHGWENFFFYAGIIALILLGIMEVASHRAAQRKDELTEQQQTETQRRHDEEIARLHLETAQANERAARIESNNLALRTTLDEIEGKIAPKSLSEKDIEEIGASLKNICANGKVHLIWNMDHKAANSLGYQIKSALIKAEMNAWAEPMINSVTDATTPGVEIRRFPGSKQEFGIGQNLDVGDGATAHCGDRIRAALMRHGVDAVFNMSVPAKADEIEIHVGPIPWQQQ